MKVKKFKGEVLAGHKESAVEMPFDPAGAWGIDPKPLWRGRKGHGVKGKLNGRAFESVVVPRMKRFWLLVDAELEQNAKVSVGEVVSVSVEPLD